MQFLEILRQHAGQNPGDPQTLETSYRQAVAEKREAAFKIDVETCFQEQPDNLLFAAWYYRLQNVAQAARQIAWKFAVPLAILNMLIFWWVSDDAYRILAQNPLILLVWSPISAILVMAYLSLATKTHFRRWAALSLILVGATAYSYYVLRWMEPSRALPASELMLLHLPVLSWMSVAVFTSGVPGSSQSRFSFMVKSLEVITFAGLFAIAEYIFIAVTIGLFDALGIQFPQLIQRLFIAGGAGLLPIIAVAMIYDPAKEPQYQDFENGLSRFLAGLLRILVVPTLLVAVIYLAFIPFNFTRPFEDRDVLIIYNAMLFAVMGLLLGATPWSLDDLSSRVQALLRGAITAIAAIAVIVSLYALSATLYRTAQDILTMNRLMIIGWNIINIGLLVYLLANQFRRLRESWAESLQRTFAVIVPSYMAWALFVILAIPLIFGRK
jgi:hypothetical protein